MCGLVALGSVEVFGITCDRGKDRCAAVNVTLWQGRVEREFAPSEVTFFTTGVDKRTFNMGSKHATIHEQPYVTLADGTKLNLRLTNPSVLVRTTTFRDLGAFLDASKRRRFTARDVFGGWFFVGSLFTMLLILIAMAVGLRVVRLQIDPRDGSVGFVRVGAFSPKFYRGHVRDVEACVRQGAVFLLTRQGDWLVLSFYPEFTESEAFTALEHVLAEVGIAVVTADERGYAPKIVYRWALVALGGLMLGLVVMAAALAGMAVAWIP